ncbi:MAG: hypothetical protein JWP95_166 [Actinotalea sp.]|nr:hypothetical protein [Actinotalea sp.]
MSGTGAGPGRPAQLSRRLRAATVRSPTYREVGATGGELPSGYRHSRRVHRIGSGAECFRTAVEHVMTWDMHRGAGLAVEATTARAEVGSTVVTALGWRRVRLPAPCRVVTVLDEPARAGFAYGTLPGHPVSGEERFVVTIDEAGAVEVHLTAFSRPATWWARLGRPVGLRVQDLVIDRYLASFPC